MYRVWIIYNWIQVKKINKDITKSKQYLKLGR